MPSILDSPSEVLHDILYYTNPSDLASVAQSCRYLNTYVDRDLLLWRRQYLAYHDPPANPTSTEPAWADLLKRNISVQNLLRSSDDTIKSEDQLERVAELISSLLLESTSEPKLNVSFLYDLFTNNESNTSSFLCRSSLFNSARLPTNSAATTRTLQQLSAKLHVYSNLSLEPRRHSLASRPKSHQVHPYARARVYDLRRYKHANHWGPFTDDGTSAVDWEKVQAIMLDLSYNVRMYAERGGADFIPPSIAPHYGRRRGTHSSRRAFTGPSAKVWDAPFWGLAPNSYISQPLSGPLSPSPNPELDAQDPYGVTGTWMRIVCFLDYSDLYNFNFEDTNQVPEGEDKPPIETREAFRLIRLKLHVTSIEEPGEDDHPDWPVVRFEGTSRSTLNAWDPNANSRIQGTVRTTPSNAIRWTTFSIFHGSPRWRSEAIQLGGPRSARGMIGNWFDKDYDEAGPAGPTAFWKISDDLEEEPKAAGIHGGGGGGWWAAAQGNGLAGVVGGDDEEGEWEDADSDDDEEGVAGGATGLRNTGGGAGGAGGLRIQIGGPNGRVLNLSDLGLVPVQDGEDGEDGGGEGGTAPGQGHGLVLPLHEVVRLLTQAFGRGEGEGQEEGVGVEELRRFLE